MNRSERAGQLLDARRPGTYQQANYGVSPGGSIAIAMASFYSHRRIPAGAPIVAILAAILASCSATEPEPPPAHSAVGCVDDSKTCIERRGQALKVMLADPKRTWVTRPENAAAYATGVKLFAYKGKKAELSCAELAHGREETRLMPQALKPGVVPGMNDSRLAQVRDLSGQMHKELSKEFDRACVSPTQAKKGFEARAPKA
jgi:hypothetical protein